LKQNPSQALIKKLQLLAKENPHISLNEYRVLIALERAIARIVRHPLLSKHLVYKGGFVLFKVLEHPRFTRDVDAIAIGIKKSDLIKYFDIALKRDLDDGLWYGDIAHEELTNQGVYGGVQFNLAFQIGNPPEKVKSKKLSRIHIDVGLGDLVSNLKPPQKMKPLISEDDPISWKIYPLEFIVSEKLEAFVSLGSINSRAKDVYDLGQLFKKINDNKKIISAIKKTFLNRKTEIPPSFKKFAESLDTSILQSAWQSVDLMGIDMSFEEIWIILIKNLSKLDKTISI
jgi:hypothetical protein